MRFQDKFLAIFFPPVNQMTAIAVLLRFFDLYFPGYHRNRQTNLAPTYRMTAALQHFPLKAPSRLNEHLTGHTPGTAIPWTW